jgi:ribosomal protein L16 Arg81 hydroxylase
VKPSRVPARIPSIHSSRAGASPAEAEIRPSHTTSSLDWLLSPTNKSDFFRDYWEKRTLIVKRGRPDYFASLLSLDEVDRVLTTLDRRYPDVSLKNADRPVKPEDFTVRDDELDVAKVYQLFAEGASITLSYLDTVVPTLTSFCRSLEAEFSAPFQTNVYLTPPGAKGFRPHYDTHDVFVMQVVGSKNWTIYGTPVELPLSSQDFDAAIHARGEPTLEFELDAGDVAYIPRGVVHDARSGAHLSLHITAGILSNTWLDLLLELVAQAGLNHPALRKALPRGFARADFDEEQAREIFRKLWDELPTNSNFDAILGRFRDEFMSMCPPPLRGQMAQMAALDRLNLESLVGAREGVISRVTTVGDRTVVECSGRTIKLPLHAGEAVRFALGRARFAVGELPGDLDDAGKLTLIRRLIREGLVMALAPDPK